MAVIYLGRSRLHRNRANLIQTLHTVAALDRLGVPITLELPPWKSPDVGARLAEFGIDTPLNLRARHLLHRRWNPRWFALLNRKRLRRQTVYLRNPQLSLALGGLGIPHHFEVHQVRALEENGSLGTVTALHRKGVIQWLVPITRAAADALVAAGADSERIHIAPSGVDLSRYRDIPAIARADLAKPRALYAGRISRSRGLDVMRALAADGTADVLLVGDAEDPVEPSEPLELRPFVPPAAVPELYREAPLVLLPYQPELPHSDAISPIKLFEAMAAGRIIIASDLPPIREVVDHERTGLLVPAGDVEAWRAAVQRLKDEPDFALMLAANARAEAPRFSWEARARGLIQALGLN